MDLSLEFIGRDSYLLCGGLNFTEIVGTRAEWLAVAAWLRKPKGKYYGAVTVIFYADGVLFRSPRALTRSDGILITWSEANKLAEHIAATLREQREPLTLGA